ncbi:MAG: hypothetical protein R2875_10750 [Desulfobacterales bacterium]
MNHISAGKNSFAGSGRLKAAVAVPPVLDFYFTRHRFSALGPHILSTLLRENGCDVLSTFRRTQQAANSAAGSL